MCREVKSRLLVYFPRVTRDFSLGNGPPPPKLWGNGDMSKGCLAKLVVGVWPLSSMWKKGAGA